MAIMDFRHMDETRKKHWIEVLCSSPDEDDKQGLSDRATVVRALVEEYPFVDTESLLASDNDVPDDEIWCELLGLPEGWIRRFGLDLLVDLKEAATKSGRYDEFKATQFKEKFGGARLYFNFTTDEIDNVVTKYEFMSERVCVACGKDATWVSTGWVCPYCDECKNKMSENRMYKPIETWCGERERDRFMMSFKPSENSAYAHNLSKSIWDWNASKWSPYLDLHETDLAFEKRHEFLSKLDAIKDERVNALLKEYDKYLY